MSVGHRERLDEESGGCQLVASIYLVPGDSGPQTDRATVHGVLWVVAGDGSVDVD